MLNNFYIFGYTPVENPETVSHHLSMKWAFYFSALVSFMFLLFVEEKFLLFNFSCSLLIALICDVLAITWFFKRSTLKMSSNVSLFEFSKNLVFTVGSLGIFAIIFYGPIFDLEPKVVYDGSGLTLKNFFIFVLLNAYFFSGLAAHLFSILFFNIIQIIHR